MNIPPFLDPSTIYRSYGAGRIYRIYRIFFVCIFNFRLPAMLRNARPPAKAARESSDAKPMADGQSEADGRGRRGQSENTKFASRKGKDRGQGSEVGRQQRAKRVRRLYRLIVSRKGAKILTLQRYLFLCDKVSSRFRLCER